MTATIHPLQPQAPAAAPATPRSWETGGYAVSTARWLLDRNVRPSTVFSEARSYPDLEPVLRSVAEAMERLEDVAETSRDLIRAAARR